jgi:hypothetical protein
MNINDVLNEVEELEDEFYGKEENDFEGGVFEENYECAEWARRNVDGLFTTIRQLTEALKEKSENLSYATDLLSSAHDLLDDVHCYETGVYKDISKFIYGEDE